MAPKYTRFTRAKNYAPDKQTVKILQRMFGGKTMQDNPKGKGGKTDG